MLAAMTAAPLRGFLLFSCTGSLELFWTTQTYIGFMALFPGRPE